MFQMNIKIRINFFIVVNIKMIQNLLIQVIGIA